IERDSDERALYARLAPDAVLLLTNSLGAAWRAWLARVPVRAGTALSGRRALLTHAVLPPTASGRRVPIPSSHMMRDAAGLLGIGVRDLHPRSIGCTRRPVFRPSSPEDRAKRRSWTRSRRTRVHRSPRTHAHPSLRMRAHRY